MDNYYIENLFYRLNNAFNNPYQSRLEPFDQICKIWSKSFQNRLKTFLKDCSPRVGKEKNLAVKQFIKEIIYSKDNILIRFDAEDIIDDDTTILDEESLRAETERDSARRGAQAMGGADRINSIFRLSQYIRSF